MSNMAEETEVYLTIAEAAKLLGITYQRVMYAIGREWLTPFQTEPVVLITRSELLRFGKEREIVFPANT